MSRLGVNSGVVINVQKSILLWTLMETNSSSSYDSTFYERNFGSTTVEVDTKKRSQSVKGNVTIGSKVQPRWHTLVSSVCGVLRLFKESKRSPHWKEWHLVLSFYFGICCLNKDGCFRHFDTLHLKSRFSELNRVNSLCKRRRNKTSSVYMKRKNKFGQN